MHFIKYVTGLKNTRNVYRILVRDLKAREHIDSIGIDERIILKLILNNLHIEAWIGF